MSPATVNDAVAAPVSNTMAVPPVEISSAVGTVPSDLMTYLHPVHSVAVTLKERVVSVAPVNETDAAG